MQNLIKMLSSFLLHSRYHILIVIFRLNPGANSTKHKREIVAQNLSKIELILFEKMYKVLIMLVACQANDATINEVEAWKNIWMNNLPQCELREERTQSEGFRLSIFRLQ